MTSGLRAIRHLLDVSSATGSGPPVRASRTPDRASATTEPGLGAVDVREPLDALPAGCPSSPAGPRPCPRVLAAAEEVGYPVAFKTTGAAHKTEVGGVALGVAGAGGGGVGVLPDEGTRLRGPGPGHGPVRGRADPRRDPRPAPRPARRARRWRGARRAGRRTRRRSAAPRPRRRRSPCWTSCRRWVAARRLPRRRARRPSRPGPRRRRPSPSSPWPGTASTPSTSTPCSAPPTASSPSTPSSSPTDLAESGDAGAERAEGETRERSTRPRREMLEQNRGRDGRCLHGSASRA